MKVVLDTSVLVSALISPFGAADQLYQVWRDGRFTLVTSAEQLEEVRRVTRYPKLKPYLHPADAGAMVNELKLLAVLVDHLPALDVSSDPGDNFILAMAQAGQADYLVTGDKAGLLALGNHETTKIVTLRQMMDVLNP